MGVASTVGPWDHMSELGRLASVASLRPVPVRS